MTDIKALMERLHYGAKCRVSLYGETPFHFHEVCAEAAQAISTLLSDNERLRGLLQEVTVKGADDLCECGQPECLTFRIRQALSPLEGRE